MEEIFETLRKQIKGGFDQNNIMFIQQKLSKLNEDLVRHETITGKPLTKEYSRFFNEPQKTI